jgi:hypothetical protein
VKGTEKMRSLESRLLFATLALAACSDDDAPVQRNIDAGQHDAGLDAHVPDASTDASVDAGSCSLDQTYKIYSSGGLVSFRDYLTVTRAGKVTLRRDRSESNLDAGVLLECSYDLPACGSAGVDAADLSAVLTRPDVIAAFSDDERVHGCDSRPIDGTVTVVERADGKTIYLGDSSREVCALSEPMSALRSVVIKLSLQYANDPDTTSCAP